MKFKISLITVLLGILMISSSISTYSNSLVPDQAAKSKLVLVITVDGFRHDLLDLADTPDIPAFDWVVDNGLRAKSMLVPNPTLTATGHVSISSGANASVHGIMGNTFYHWEDNYTYSLFSDDSDPYRNTDTGANILQSPQGYHWAVNEGYKSGVVGWTYSDGTYTGIVEGSSVSLAPTVNVPYSDVAGAPDKGIASKILGIIDGTPGMNLIYARFNGIDSALHYNDISSSNYKNSWEKTNDGLQVLLEGLVSRGMMETTTIMLMGDHGMSKLTNSKFFLEDTTEWANAIQTTGVTPLMAVDSGLSYLYFLDDTTTTTQVQDFATALRANTNIEKVLVNEEHIPYGLYNPSVGMNISVWFNSDISRNFGSEFANMHGYLNSNEDMRSSFIMVGAGVNTSATIGDMKAIDVTPTALELLGINALPTAQGAARADVLADVSGPKGDDLPTVASSTEVSSTTDEGPIGILPLFASLGIMVVFLRRKSDQ